MITKKTGCSVVAFVCMVATTTFAQDTITMEMMWPKTNMLYLSGTNAGMWIIEHVTTATNYSLPPVLATLLFSAPVGVPGVVWD